jgi:hypothetical protein
VHYSGVAILTIAAAYFVFAIHLTFILFVVFGALLVVRFRRLAWIHVPAVIWGASAVLLGLTCPLTPIENQLLQLSGAAGYADSFIGHYLVPLIYPDALTRQVQAAMGIGVIAINLLIYSVIAARRRGSAWPASPECAKGRDLNRH